MENAYPFEQCEARKIRRMLGLVVAIHSVLIEGGREGLGPDEFVDVVWRPWCNVQDTHGPRTTQALNPANDIAVAPRQQGIEAFVPEGPHILLRGDWLVHAQAFGNLVRTLRVRLSCGDDLQELLSFLIEVDWFHRRCQYVCRAVIIRGWLTLYAEVIQLYQLNIFCTLASYRS